MTILDRYRCAVCNERNAAWGFGEMWACDRHRAEVQRGWVPSEYRPLPRATTKPDRRKLVMKAARQASLTL